jgi:hypothetical protein
MLSCYSCSIKKRKNAENVAWKNNNRRKTERGRNRERMNNALLRRRRCCWPLVSLFSCFGRVSLQFFACRWLNSMNKIAEKSDCELIATLSAIAVSLFA